MYIATKDIDAKHLKVKKGCPLPNRFQNRMFLRALKKEFGDDAFDEVTYGKDKYITVERDELDLMVMELNELREKVHGKTKSPPRSDPPQPTLDH